MALFWGNGKKLRKDAAKALEQMYQDALDEDYHLVLNSGYRSYESQTKIYDEEKLWWKQMKERIRNKKTSTIPI